MSGSDWESEYRLGGVEDGPPTSESIASRESASWVGVLVYAMLVVGGLWYAVCSGWFGYWRGH